MSEIRQPPVKITSSPATKSTPRAPTATGGSTAKPKDTTTVIEEELFAKKINSLSLQYLLMETVPLSIRVSERLVEISKKAGGLIETDIKKLSVKDNKLDDFHPGGIEGLCKESEITNNDNLYRIENYGYQMGLKITDCLVYMNNDSNLKVLEVLEIMKFICRDVWKIFYQKQMDNLRTNHIVRIRDP